MHPSDELPFSSFPSEFLLPAFDSHMRHKLLPYYHYNPRNRDYHLDRFVDLRGSSSVRTMKGLDVFYANKAEISLLGIIPKSTRHSSPLHQTLRTSATNSNLDTAGRMIRAPSYNVQMPFP